jgi:hypothetical protein
MPRTIRLRARKAASEAELHSSIRVVGRTPQLVTDLLVCIPNGDASVAWRGPMSRNSRRLYLHRLIKKGFLQSRLLRLRGSSAREVRTTGVTCALGSFAACSCATFELSLFATVTRRGPKFDWYRMCSCMSLSSAYGPVSLVPRLDGNSDGQKGRWATGTSS